MRFLTPAIVLALFAPQQSDDPVAALKELAKKGDSAAAQKVLREGLDREIAAGMKALEENRPDKIELHLGRAATLARSYSDPYARMLVSQILIARRQVRLEGAALVRAVAEDIRASKPYADRIAQARKDGSVRVYTDLLASLEARAKEWSGAPPQPAAVDAEAAKWMSIKANGPALGCGTCKGAGDVLCTCKEGLVAAACRTCNGAGTIACLLCEGRGTVAHGGYVGTIKLRLEKEIRVKVVLANGKNANAVLKPQEITWVTSSCAGKGRFTLKTDSRPLAGGATTSNQVDQTCERLWKELRNFAFTGRAKMEIQTEAGGRLSAIEPQAAKRFLADYEKCSDGKLPCERCEKKLTNPCMTCLGRGSMPGPCSLCGGASSTLCASCGFVGDTMWLAALVKPETVADLGPALDRHGEALRGWAQYRAWTAGRRIDLTAQLKAAKMGLDASAVLTPQHVNVACPLCKGRGGECEGCWATGRREYYEGTPEYEKYAKVARLDRQLAELAKEAKRPAPMPDIKLTDPAAKPPPPKPVDFGNTKGAGTGGDIASLPPAIKETIAKADQASADGQKHLETAKTSGNNDTWIDESKKALDRLREAQSLYANAQETCDAQGVPVPKELLDKFRKNMQALVIARKQSP